MDRSLENALYSIARKKFLAAHRICPVTGQEATQVHHSAKRDGRFQNLERYWIAVSPQGHEWIESHKKDAERLGLMVRINQTSSEHIAALEAQGISLTIPVFYESWSGVPLVKTIFSSEIDSGFD